MPKVIKLHYSRSKPNLGDQLSPVICKMVSGCEIVHSKVGQCDLLAIGSVLDRVKEHIFAKRIHIWGSGFIRPVARHKTRHFVAAVRGKKSAEILTNVEVKALGDPGLLTDMLIPGHGSIAKLHKVGIVPHYIERENPAMLAFLKQNPQVKFIDIFSGIDDFLKQLASCEFIFSSSLHGLIIADSLGIANCRFRLSNEIVGGDFKYEDYYSIFANPIPKPVTLDMFNNELIRRLTDEYRRDNIVDIKKSLVRAFPLAD